MRFLRNPKDLRILPKFLRKDCRFSSETLMPMLYALSGKCFKHERAYTQPETDLIQNDIIVLSYGHGSKSP